MSGSQVRPSEAEERRISLRLLGRPQVQHGSHKVPLGGGALRLLALLAVDGPQTRSRLADQLWEGSISSRPESLDSRTRRRLRSCLLIITARYLVAIGHAAAPVGRNNSPPPVRVGDVTDSLLTGCP